MSCNIIIAFIYGILSTFFITPYYIKGLLKGKTLLKNYDNYYNFSLSVRNTIYFLSIVNFILVFSVTISLYTLKDFILSILIIFFIFSGHIGFLYLSHYFLPISEFKKYAIFLLIMFAIIMFINIIYIFII